MSATLSQPSDSASVRLDYLDAARAFALLLGVVFHASLSFLPIFIGWAVQDVSTGQTVLHFVIVSHSFRMALFFALAGFLTQSVVRRRGGVAVLKSRAVRLGVPFVVGWFLFKPLLVAGWTMGIASVRGDYSVAEGLKVGIQSLGTNPARWFTQSHLWFLYYLMLVTGLALTLRSIWPAMRGFGRAVQRGADAAMRWIGTAPGAWLLLVVPTVALLQGMNRWGVDTPDQSLLPLWRMVGLYGGAFGLGWLWARQPEVWDRLIRLRMSVWAGAGVGIGAAILLAKFESDPGHPGYATFRFLFHGAYALMMWSLIFLTLGLAKRWFSRPSARVRYIADASYWLYLLHLPVVLWLQVAVAEWAWIWPFKLLLISALTIALGLLTYDAFVRSTWVGTVLNGRKRSRVLLPRLVKLGQMRGSEITPRAAIPRD